MKVSKTLEVVRGRDEIKDFINIINLLEPGKIPERILEIVEDPTRLKGTAGVGLGINTKTREPVAAALINYKDEPLTFLIGNEVIELIEYIEYKLKYDSNVVLAVSQAFLHNLRAADFADELKFPKGHNFTRTKFGGMEDDILPQPTNPSRELTTVRGMEVLKVLSQWSDTRATFKTVSKSLLLKESSMAVTFKLPEDNDPDVKYGFFIRLGEPKNDPTEADLLAMIAYQPEVLYNGVKFNPDIPEVAKDTFESEFKPKFNF